MEDDTGGSRSNAPRRQRPRGNGGGGSRRTADTVFGDPLLATAIDFYERIKRPGVARVRALRDWRGLLAVLRLMACLPCLAVSPSSAPSGEAIRRQLLTRRRWLPPTYRVAQGVLVLPATSEEYRRGRSRQAMRTNVHHAESLGLSCRRVTAAGERETFSRSPFFGPPGRLEMLADTPGRDCWIVTDAGSQPVGVGVVSIDTDVALLWYLVTTNHPARWLLNLRIAESLIADGVSLLLVDDGHVLQMKASTRYLQMLLGYRVAHLSLTDVPLHRRRMAAGLRAVGRLVAVDLTRWS